MANLLRWSVGMALPKKKEENQTTPLITSLRTMNPIVSRPNNTTTSNATSGASRVFSRVQQINDQIRQQAEQRRQQEEQQRQQRIAEQQRQQEQRRQQEEARKQAQQRLQEQKQRNLLNSAGLGNSGFGAADLRANLEARKQAIAKRQQETITNKEQQQQEEAEKQRQLNENETNRLINTYTKRLERNREILNRFRAGEKLPGQLNAFGDYTELGVTNNFGKEAPLKVKTGLPLTEKQLENRVKEDEKTLEMVKKGAKPITLAHGLRVVGDELSQAAGNAIFGEATEDENALKKIARTIVNVPLSMIGSPLGIPDLIGNAVNPYETRNEIQKNSDGTASINTKKNTALTRIGSGADAALRLWDSLSGGEKEIITSLAGKGAKASLLNTLKNMGKTALEEGIQESAENLAEELADQGKWDEGTIGRTVESGLLGAATGGAMSGISSGINGIRQRIANKVNSNVNVNEDINTNTNINEEANIDPSRVQTTQDGTMVKTNADGTATKLSDTELSNVITNNGTQSVTKGVNPFMNNSINLNSSEDLNTLARRAEQGDSYAQQRLAEITEQEEQNTDWRGKSVEEVINQRPQSLVESAKQYGINDSDGKIQDIQNMLGRQNITARYDADAFRDSNENAMWRIYQDENGNTVREVVFNPNAKGDAIVQELAVHELAHDIFAKNTKTSEQLYQNVKQWLENDSEYQQQLNDLKNTYGDVDVEEEAVAKALQSKFGNQEEINRLVNYEPNVARKIYDWVVDKLNKVTGGRIEKLYWADIKNKFERAYSENGNYTTDNGQAYHISEKFSDEIDAALDGRLRKGEQVKARDFTPKILVDNGVRDLPMLITQNHIKSIIYTNQEAKALGLNPKYNYHGLGKDLLIKAIDNLDNPSAIHKLDGNNYLVVTEFSDREGNNIVVPIKINGKGNYNDVYIDENQIKSVYGKEKLDRYLRKNSVEQIYKKEAPALNERGQSPNISNNASTLNIPQDTNNVNTKMSITPTTDSNGKTLSKQQQEYFKDSKVRDENGNLRVMYHGTPNGDFNTFNGGSYFTSNKTYADGYQDATASVLGHGKQTTNPKTFEVYLDVTKPFTLSDQKAKDIYLNEYIKGGNSLYFDPYTDYRETINGLDEVDWSEGENLKEWLQENHPEYDGLYLDEGGSGGYGEAEYRWRGISVVPFSSEQIKSVSNTNPTTNPDIRYDKASDFDDYVDKRANAGRSYDTEADTLPEDFDVKHYVTDQVEAQNKRSKLPLRERIADTTAELKHYLVDDAVAYERYIKDKNERLNIREGVDRVRSSDMIARQYMMDNGLGEVVKMSDADLNEFQQYLIAKRALEVAEQGKATGRSKAADQALIDAVGDKYAKQEQIIRDYTRGMLEYSADNGLISQKLKDDLIENNPNYVPMNRVFDVLEKKTGFKSKQLGNLSKQSVVQKMTGSERVVENPIESLMANTLRMVNEVERNNTAKLIADSKTFHEKVLAEGEKPRPGYDTLNYMVDGKKVSYEVPELVAQEMKNLNSVLPKSIEIPTRIFGTPTRWLRSGATQNNPIFAVSNLLRDQMQTVVTGKVSSNLKGTKDALIATFSPTKRGKELRAELNRAGIIGSEYRQTYGYKSGNLIAQLQADNNVSKAAMNKLKHPVDAIGDLIGRTEYFTRAQQYFGADGDATTKAQAARNNTLNFNRAGSITRVLNRVIPFLNAGVQGGRITVNSFKNRPVHTTLAIASLTGIALAAKGAAEAQDKELWDRIDESDKGQNIIIFTPNAHYDSDTNRVEGIIKIPVAQMLYPVMDATNNLKGDPSDLTMLAGDIFTATTGIEAPTEEKGFLPVVNQLMPTAFKPIIETSFNKNLFTGGEIVKDYEKNMNPEDKSAKYTSGLARTIAKATGIDAPDVDNFIQNWGGGLAKDLSKVMTDNPDNVKDGGGVGKMFENGFNRRFLSGTVESQYEIAEGLAKNYKNEVKNSDAFKSLDKEQQESVLNAIDSDMKGIANVSTKVEQGKANDKTSLTKRQTEIVSNGFNIDSYINSVIDKKATYTGSGDKSAGKTLTGNVLDYGKTAVRNNAVEINDSISDNSKSILGKYNSMKSDDWNDYLYGTSAESAAAEYNLAKAKYENDLANDKLTEPQKIKREKELAKLEVSQKWTKDYRDAYSLAGTKADMQAYLDTLDEDTRAKTVATLNGLNNAMYEAGIITKSTYNTRYNAINNTTSKKSSGKKKSKSDGISSAEASALSSLAKTLAKNTNSTKANTPSVPETKRKIARTKSSGNSTGLKTYAPSGKKQISVTKGANRSIA